MITTFMRVSHTTSGTWNFSNNLIRATNPFFFVVIEIPFDIDGRDFAASAVVSGERDRAAHGHVLIVAGIDKQAGGVFDLGESQIERDLAAHDKLFA